MVFRDGPNAGVQKGLRQVVVERQGEAATEGGIGLKRAKIPGDGSLGTWHI